MKPTIKNLKQITRKSFEPEPYARYIVRPISIWFTWLFVRTPISANQVTVLQEIFGVAGAILIAFGKLKLSLFGVALLQLGYILDCSDGEVARWKQQQSTNGVFLDLVGHLIVIPGYVFALGFGVWMQTGRIEALVAGFIAALFGLRLERMTLLSVVDSLITETEKPQYDFKKLNSKTQEISENIEMGSAGSIGRRSLLQIPFRYPDSMNIITIIVIIEYILSELIKVETTQPISYYFIMLFSFVMFFGRLVQIYRVFNKGLVENRFLQILKLSKKITQSNK